MKKTLPIFAIVLCFVLLTDCEDSVASGTAAASSAMGISAAASNIPRADTPTAGAGEPVDDSDFELLGDLNLTVKRYTGDLDVLEKERIIRILTVYGLGRYFLDGPKEKGMVHEVGRKLEDFMNERLGKKNVRIHVGIIPIARDKLISALLEGRGDIAMAGLTITPDRAEKIDFTNPASKPLSEILVTGPTAPELNTINDLAGQEIYARPSSSYYQSLLELNARFKAENLSPMVIQDATEVFEDEDLLEMVNAGLLPWTVVDDYKAEIWSGVFSSLKPRQDIVLRQGGQIAFAIRKESPKLMAALNDFLTSHRQGTLQGNMLINRWYRDFDWAKNALGADDYHRFEELAGIFKTYGEQYGVDYLMVAAQGYQESRLNQAARSNAGAVGVMQLLPSTASDPIVGIPDITQADANIHAGVKYLDWIRKTYFNDPGIDPFDQTLLAFAAYNAGPGRIRQLREKAVQQGYDPNVWFDNVELVSAQVIGRETNQYVANIVKYYAAYRLTAADQLRRAAELKKTGVKKQ